MTVTSKSQKSSGKLSTLCPRDRTSARLRIGNTRSPTIWDPSRPCTTSVTSVAKFISSVAPGILQSAYQLCDRTSISIHVTVIAFFAVFKRGSDHLIYLLLPDFDFT